MTRPGLAGLSPVALARRVPGLGAGEARKAVALFHREGALRPVPGLGRGAIARIDAATSVERLRVVERHRSAEDAFVRYLLEAPDGARVESVKIPLEVAERHVVCVSAQVGCALGCVYCATDQLGLSRNLEAWEIVEQVRVVREELGERRGRAGGERVHGVVFQGMGEALANLDAVLGAVAVLTDPSALAIDGRTITVSTVGLPGGIRRLAEAAPKLRLALSVGSARPAVRRRLFPVARAHPLDEVMEAVAEHARSTGRAPLWAVTLLEGVNDSRADAEALVELARDFRARTGKRPRMSIVPYNEVSFGPVAGPPVGEGFRRCSDEREEAFRAVLRRAGLPSHRRMSGGGAVRGACGQLSGEAARRTC